MVSFLLLHQFLPLQLLFPRSPRQNVEENKVREGPEAQKNHLYRNAQNTRRYGICGAFRQRYSKSEEMVSKSPKSCKHLRGGSGEQSRWPRGTLWVVELLLTSWRQAGAPPTPPSTSSDEKRNFEACCQITEVTLCWEYGAGFFPTQ